MEYRTKEMIITLRSDNIIVSALNENIRELTVEGVKEVLEILRILNETNEKPKGLISDMPPFYVSKKIIKMYTTTEVIIPIALGVVANSFASKLVGNLFLTIRGRLLSSKGDYPVKVFGKKEDAIEWVKGYVEKAIQEATTS
jgi:hypothetical protein